MADFHKAGASIVTGGRIRFVHRGKNPADYPEADDILASISALTESR